MSPHCSGFAASERQRGTPQTGDLAGNPAYNEADNLAGLYDRIAGVMTATGLPWEWVVVDDHSSDRTFAVISELASRNPCIHGVRFARNFGSHAAILCGLADARGDAAIVLAGDGQNPPEEIPRLIAGWREGNAIVWAEGAPNGAVRSGTRLTSGLFHRVLRSWSGLTNLSPAGSDFFLVSRPVIDVVNTLGVMALLAWIGFEQGTIQYQKHPRDRGVSGWTGAKKIKLAIDSILGFSVRPVQAMSVAGFLIARSALSTPQSSLPTRFSAGRSKGGRR